MSHPEHTKENSLTAPQDRDPSRTYRVDQSAPALTETQATDALQELNNTAFVERFPHVERRYADPGIPLQHIGLISFVPSKDAKPDSKGIFGFAKLRGNYATPAEANERAEYLIRNVDSYHQIYHTYVGRPFPITISSSFSKDVDQVDLRKDMTQTISNDVKQKRLKEEKEMEEIRQREANLLERNQQVMNHPENKEFDESDPEVILDQYITLRVKKAQLSWAFLETKKKQEEVLTILAKTRHELEEMEKSNPEHKEKYFQKYTKARKEAHLDTATHQENFMKFMVEDASIPEVDVEYEKLILNLSLEDVERAEVPEVETVTPEL